MIRAGETRDGNCQEEDTQRLGRLKIGHLVWANRGKIKDFFKDNGQDAIIKRRTDIRSRAGSGEEGIKFGPD